MRRWVVVTAVLLGMMALAACAAREEAKPAPAAPAAAPAAPEAKPAWEQEWERVVAAAKREGRVAVLGPAGADLRRALTEPFERKYGISVEFLGHRGAEIVPRMRSEREAGQYLWDLRVGGTSTALITMKPEKMLDPLEPALILPEVKEPKSWRGGRLPLLDKEGMVLAMANYATEAIAINTTLAKVEEFKSYRDLLDPKWKGRIMIYDPTLPGAGDAKLAFFYLHKDLGPDFIRALARQEPVFMREPAQQSEWLAQGKYAIALGADKPTSMPLKRAGAPIEYVSARQMREGGSIHVGIAGLSLINKAPHPNAAKLYINWLLSKEGALPFVQAGPYPSVRVDMPTDHVQPWEIPVEGYMSLDDEESARVRVRVRDFIKEVFGVR